MCVYLHGVRCSLAKGEGGGPSEGERASTRGFFAYAVRKTRRREKVRGQVAECHIVIYEPRRLVREGLAVFLGAQFDVTVCGKVAELELLLRGRLTAAIVSLDGVTDALWCVLAGPLKSRRTLRVIGIASVLDPATARRARSVGVREIMPSEAGLQGVIDLLGTPRRWSSGGAVPLRVVPAPLPELTPRERDVIQLISRGSDRAPDRG